MQVGWVESIPGGPEGLGYVHTNRQYYPDMFVKSLVGKRASYSGTITFEQKIEDFLQILIENP